MSHPVSPPSPVSTPSPGGTPSPGSTPTPLSTRPSSFRARRRRDRIIAGAIAVAVIAAATIVYLTSDIRAVDATSGPDYTPTVAMSAVPQRLQVAWQQPTDPEVGAVASPYGTVVTTDQHTVTGRNAATGGVRWSYSRADRNLCAVGSGDTTTGDLSASSSVRGVLAVYARDGLCGEMVLLNPKTGERRYQRTAPNQPSGSLIFGGPYAAWVSSGLLEIWRWDLLRTFQYGDQPNPSSGNTRHLGCTITDAAVTDDQFGTIEHCTGKGSNARIVLNWTDPNSQNKKDWDVFKTKARADIDTGSAAARIVGITKDRVAVLVATPTPAVVAYDADGTVAGRTPIAVAASAIGSNSGPTPRVTLDGIQYSLVGGYLIAMGEETVDVTVPVTATSGTNEPSKTPDAGLASRLGGTATSTPTPPKTKTKVVSRDSPTVSWALPGAIGLPTLVGANLVVASAGGLMVVPAAEGTVARTVPLARPAKPARVDVAVVGNRLVELRGTEVVSLAAAP